jgi:hypothetical protein
LEERIAMWIFDSYFKGCGELWSIERDLSGKEMIQDLESQ